MEKKTVAGIAQPFIKLRGYKVVSPKSEKTNIMRIIFPQKQMIDGEWVDQTTPQGEFHMKNKNQSFTVLDDVLLVNDPMNLGIDFNNDINDDASTNPSWLEYTTEDNQQIESSTKAIRKYKKVKGKVLMTREVQPDPEANPQTESPIVSETNSPMATPEIPKEEPKPEQQIQTDAPAKEADKVEPVESTTKEEIVGSPKAEPVTEQPANDVPVETTTEMKSVQENVTTEKEQIVGASLPEVMDDKATVQITTTEDKEDNDRKTLADEKAMEQSLVPNENAQTTVPDTKEQTLGATAVDNKEESTQSSASESTKKEDVPEKSQTDETTTVPPTEAVEKEVSLGSTLDNKSEVEPKVEEVTTSKPETPETTASESSVGQAEVTEQSTTPKSAEQPKEESVGSAQVVDIPNENTSSVIPDATQTSTEPILSNKDASTQSEVTTTTETSTEAKVVETTTESKPQETTTTTVAPQTTVKPRKLVVKATTKAPRTESPLMASFPGAQPPPHPLLSRILLTASRPFQQMPFFMQRNRNNALMNPLIKMAAPVFRRKKKHVKREAKNSEEVFVTPKPFEPIRSETDVVSSTTRRPNLFERYHAMDSGEKAEKISKILEKVMHGVTIAGHVDGYLANRAKTGIKKLHKLFATSEEQN